MVSLPHLKRPASSPAHDDVSDFALVALVRAGDEGALSTLYARHNPLLRRILGRYGRDLDEVEDLAQETWLRVLRALSAFRGTCKFSVWLYRIATNTALEINRRSSSGSKLSPFRTVEAISPDRAEEIAIRCTLQALPEGMRVVTILYSHGFHHYEIAAALGITAGTSKSQLSKARRKLRALL